MLAIVSNGNEYWEDCMFGVVGGLNDETKFKSAVQDLTETTDVPDPQPLSLEKFDEFLEKYEMSSFWLDDHMISYIIINESEEFTPTIFILVELNNLS